MDQSMKQIQRAKDLAFEVYQCLQRANVTGKMLTDAYDLHNLIAGAEAQLAGENLKRVRELTREAKVQR